MEELQIKKKLKYELDKYRKSYFNYHLKNKSLGSPKIRDSNPYYFFNTKSRHDIFCKK